MSDPILLMGGPGSPYTRKMLGVLRYRRIPHRLLSRAEAGAAGLPQPRVALLPTVFMPDQDGQLQAVTDSTPIIRRLEHERTERSLLPDDPALRFLDELIEDYADEWLTKCMFHYRWAFAADAAQAGRQLPLWQGWSIPDAQLDAAAKTITERQVGRLHVVGSNPVTAPVIEASYHRFLELFEARLRESPFTLGGRPTACDFALFGQLTQLALFDPTPRELTVRTAPRVFAWTHVVEDLSGHEPKGSLVDPASPPASLLGLLGEIGRTYVPVMLATAAAVRSGSTEVKAEVDGLAWRQSPFPYQAKTLGWLREAYSRLDPEARSGVDGAIAGTGCERLFA